VKKQRIEYNSSKIGAIGMEKKTQKKEITKYSFMVLVFVLSIVVIGVSLSYAYFSANFTGKNETGLNKTAKLNVTTTLTTAPVIDSSQLALIENVDYKTKAEKITFTVTNENTSNVNAKYTIKLVEMSLSKNLFSKYFKWKLVINEGTENEKEFNGDFADAETATEGTDDKTELTNLTKQLIGEEEALTLAISQTDSIVFYLWLENEAEVDQLYLTEGKFKGKLSMDAIPTKEGL